MSEEKIEFLPYEMAVKFVGAIQEEEHPHKNNHRIFTVYDANDRELCWFDAEETIAIVAAGNVSVKKDQIQEQVQTYILHRIPQWVLDE